MTLKQMEQKLEDQRNKLYVASEMDGLLNRFLGNYFSYAKDENGETKYDENYNPMIDLTQPMWDDERSAKALELKEYLNQAMMKWIEK